METITVLETDCYGPPMYAGLRMTKAKFLNWAPDNNYVYEFLALLGKHAITKKASI
ncbi:MAG: hypothetical protein H7319_06465 [Spirosoma sp.]|nr:hypothetical protein [Spirosoma sp.]